MSPLPPGSQPLAAREPSWRPTGLLLLSLARLLEGLAAGTIFLALPAAVAALPTAGLFGSLHQALRVGALISIFGLFMMPGQLAAGYLTDRGVSRRGLALAALCGAALATALLTEATVYWHLVVLRIAQAVFAGVVVPTTASLVASSARREEVGAAFGFYTSARMVGLSLGPLLGGLLVSMSSREWAYLLPAALLIAACLPLLLLRRSPEEKGLAGGRSAAAPATDRSSTGAPPAYLFLAAAAFVSSGCATSLGVLQNDFVARFGHQTVGFGLAIGAMLVVRMALSWPVGRLVDLLNPRAVSVVGLMVLSTSTALLGLTTSYTQLIFVRIGMGVGMALFSVPCLAWISSRNRDSWSNVSLSVVTAGFSLGVGIGPCVTGLLAALLGTEGPFLFWSVLGWAISVAWVAGPRDYAARFHRSIRRASSAT